MAIAASFHERTPTTTAPVRRQPAAPAPRRQPAERAQDQVTLSPAARHVQLHRVDERSENALIEQNDGRGVLVPLANGPRRNGTTVTIHGANASPEAVQPLSERAAGRGQSVYTFAYDDRHRRLTDTSQDLADSLGALRAQRPGQPVTLQAHSMGGRVAVDALRRMQEAGIATEGIQLDLVNPILGGVGGANFARLAPSFIGRQIPMVEPGTDIGTNSPFQASLESTNAPTGVRTRIFVGENDPQVSVSDERFQRVAQRLRAQVQVIPGADHDSAVDVVAR